MEKKEGEEEKKEGEEAVVEEIEEPDDTPVDLSEFWVKPDQVIFSFVIGSSFLFL